MDSGGIRTAKAFSEDEGAFMGQSSNLIIALVVLGLQFPTVVVVFGRWSCLGGGCVWEVVVFGRWSSLGGGCL